MDESELAPPFPPPPQVVSRQSGATIYLLGYGPIMKSGHRVKPTEELAMRLVREHTNVPVPKPFYSRFEDDYGEIIMTHIPGVSLETCWQNLHDDDKRRLCNQLWGMIEQWRQIPKPPHLSNTYLCYTDGSPSVDVLIKDLEDPPRLLVDDESVRERIFQRYYHYNGRKYTQAELNSMLPQSTQSVFTHADLAPYNIMVNGSPPEITGILDWERAGWYPDYWECANISKSYDDWSWWMELTNSTTWTREHMKGIDAARRVLI